MSRADMNGSSAWFSNSVPDELLHRWEDAGGVIGPKKTATFLISANSDAEDTRKLYKRGGPTIFKSSLIDALLASKRPTTVDTKRFILRQGEVDQAYFPDSDEHVSTDDDEQDESALHNQEEDHDSRDSMQEGEGDDGTDGQHDHGHRTQQRRRRKEETWLCNGKAMTYTNHLIRDIRHIDTLKAKLKKASSKFEIVKLDPKNSSGWKVVRDPEYR
eukprot:TRINITY_DN6016_c0_g2_i1.p1 TRINITY_DN6016_c0_g2~~TRINITY_DN6016_c0_g2_i1.p1  ORF type:complete len:216 (+),score=40.20 TRINITY_DN6016_c0_g2_i1:27-674(+)